MISQRHEYAPLPSPLAELQQCPQWVCWKREERKDKPTKVPYNPRTGKPARSNDPATWASYAEAARACEQEPGNYQGIGYMFAQDVTGVDLDHCILSDGSIEPWARRVLEVLGSYAEYSPNDGIHIFLRGAIPAGKRRRVAGGAHKDAAVEMYSQGRYFTITGRPVPDSPMHLALVGADLPLLVDAASARNGEKFCSLWSGDTASYLSASEADQALCNLLAYWAGNDPARVDRLFRQSRLYRPDKWDRAARAGETYGWGTVTRACQGLSQDKRGAPRDIAENARGQGLILPFRAKAKQEDELVYLGELPQVDLAFIQDCLAREEEGDARLYAYLFRGRCIYDHTEGLWYEWQGHVWKRDEQKHALVLVSNPLAATYVEAGSVLSEQVAEQTRRINPDLKDADTDQQKERLVWLKKETAALFDRARKLKTLKRMEHVLTIAQALLPITSKAWDRNPWLLACANGVLDLQTGELHPGRPDDYIRSAIPTEWLGLDTPAPRWEQFLQEVFDDRDQAARTDLIAFLQRQLGYGITGSVEEHVFLVLYGEEGRNGKDTIQRAISTTLGGEVSSAISKDVLLETGRARTAGSATPHICDLQGKRLAWASEPEKGARFSVSQVKEYSGGGEIPSRGMYERSISKIKPTHLLILLTNHKPYADAEDKAFWDRLRLITFNLRFVDHPSASNERKKDTKLWQALEAEASGILAWLVRGCLEWQRRGLDTPPTIIADGEQYRREQDALDLFLSSYCVLDEQASARASALYTAYVTWGKNNNLRNLMTGTSFGKKLAKRFEKKHTDKGVAYRGVRLLEQADNPTLFDMEETTPGESLTGLTSSDGFGNEPISPVELALEAAGDTSQQTPSDGLMGSYRKSPKNAKNESLRGLPVPTHQPISLEKTASLNPPVERLQQADGLEKATLQNPSNPSGIPLPSWPADAEFVSTIDGLGYRTGNRIEKEIEFMAPERKERFRYMYGVVGLLDGEEHFYYPNMIFKASREEVEAWLARSTGPASNGSPEEEWEEWDL